MERDAAARGGLRQTTHKAWRVREREGVRVLRQRKIGHRQLMLSGGSTAGCREKDQMCKAAQAGVEPPVYLLVFKLIIWAAFFK